MQTDRRHATLDLRKPVIGVILALLALLVWPNRAVISSWFATSYTASIRLTTTTETNDTRLRRAFDAARPDEESLELIPGLRQIRHGVVHVPGSTRAEAIAKAEAFSRALVAAFDAAGPGHLDAAMRLRADPMPGAASQTALALLTLGAPALGLFAIVLLRAGWCVWRAKDPDSLRDGAGYAVAGGLALAIAPFVIPGWLFMALFAMAIPSAIAGMIVYKMRDVRRAAAWPSAQGRILHSRTRVVRRKQSNGSMTVSNVPDVEYAYSVDDIEYKGKRIGLGEIAAGSPEAEASLERYQVGRTGPVYYNPDDPKEAVLERDPPVSPVTMYSIAAGVLLVGFAVVITFTRAVEIIRWLELYFPQGAVVQGFLFCLAAGVVVLLFTLSDHRAATTAARWPTTEGMVLSSTVRSHRMLMPGRGGQTMEVWSPLVEFNYRVGERSYHGARVAFGPVVVGGRALAELTCARYPAGSAVTVHYDPANPSFSVLETRMAFSWRSFAVIVAFFAAALFFSGVAAVGVVKQGPERGRDREQSHPRSCHPSCRGHPHEAAASFSISRKARPCGRRRHKARLSSDA